MKIVLFDRDKFSQIFYLSEASLRFVLESNF